MILTYKYRIKDRSARKSLRRHAWAANQVWNYCAAQQRDVDQRWRAGEKPRKWASHFDFQKLTKGVGKHIGLHQQSVGEVCRIFAEARNQTRRAPAFRSSFGKSRALGWVPFRRQGRQIDGNTVTYLGKRYRFFGSRRRPLPSNAGGGYFVEDALGRWFVCFHVEVDRNGNSGAIGSIGIDLGLKTFATLSDGRKIAAPAFYRTHERQLAAAQRARNQQRVRRLHTKIANCRRDFLHKVSTDLATRYALIAVGNVNAKKLARTRFSKSVNDASWSMFRNALRYKSFEYVDVDEKFTTQVCSECGGIPASRPRGIADIGIREWKCSDCGASHDRDVNAARNILTFARSVARPVEESRRTFFVRRISANAG